VPENGTKMKTKALNSTGEDIVNCLHLNVVFIYIEVISESF